LLGFALIAFETIFHDHRNFGFVRKHKQAEEFPLSFPRRWKFHLTKGDGEDEGISDEDVNKQDNRMRFSFWLPFRSQHGGDGSKLPC